MPEVTDNKKVNGQDSLGAYTEEAMIWGDTRDTPELHNVKYADGQGCFRVGDGKWCFKRTDLTVQTPNPRWVFVGPPVVQCVRDNQGSAAWNVLGAPDRFFIDLQNPTDIRVHILTNSRSIGVRIGALARYYP
jgi:hypothetical protein